MYILRIDLFGVMYVRLMGSFGSGDIEFIFNVVMCRVCFLFFGVIISINNKNI